MTKAKPTKGIVPKFVYIRKNDWVLLANGSKEIAHAFDTKKLNDHGENFIWALTPSQRLGHVGTGPNVIDARLKAQKFLNQF
jgi:hypothetical protein